MFGVTASSDVGIGVLGIGVRAYGVGSVKGLGVKVAESKLHGFPARVERVCEGSP